MVDRSGLLRNWIIDDAQRREIGDIAILLCRP